MRSAVVGVFVALAAFVLYQEWIADHHRLESVPIPSPDMEYLRVMNLTLWERDLPPTENPTCSHILCKFTNLLNSGVIRLPFSDVNDDKVMSYSCGMHSRFTMENSTVTFTLDHRDLYPDNWDTNWYYFKLDYFFSILSKCHPTMYGFITYDLNCYYWQQDFIHKVNTLVEETGLSYRKRYIPSANTDRFLLAQQLYWDFSSQFYGTTAHPALY